MIKEIDIIVSPRIAADQKLYLAEAAKKAGINLKDITYSKLVRRSIDARSKLIKVSLRVLLVTDNISYKPHHAVFEYPDVSNKEEVIIIGAGPAGLFAALRLIEQGKRPIVLERGKNISERKKDIALLNRNESLNKDSNYCFGEGGAGTFSDGKIYTRSKKRGNVRKILEIFHYHGASEDILIESHPHIGTDKLTQIIKSIRQTILNSGGIIHFNTRVVDFMLKGDTINSVLTHKGDNISAKAVVLATGHSARDIYELLHKKNIEIESKPFAMGVRVEHPQPLIDYIQYNGYENNYLPAASYSLTTQVANRGVYSFCMCPGGTIVPSATDVDEVVTNGMSSSRRNSPYANSGIAVEIRNEDLKEYAQYGNLAGLKFQKELEQMASRNGGIEQTAPAQLLGDFVQGKLSQRLVDCSYNPGILSSPLHFWLPSHISNRLQKGFSDFEKKMKGYLTNEAIIIGVESRTSSPVRIPRNTETFQHIRIKNLYPCGEGSGYSGGIVSSAIDGENSADKIK